MYIWYVLPIIFYVFLTDPIPARADVCEAAGTIFEDRVCEDAALKQAWRLMQERRSDAKSRIPLAYRPVFDERMKIEDLWTLLSCESHKCIESRLIQKEMRLDEIISGQLSLFCRQHGPALLTGEVERRIMLLEPDSRLGSATMLKLDEPICYSDLNDFNETEIFEIEWIEEVQIVFVSDETLAPRVNELSDERIAIVGWLSARNTSQYYFNGFAIDVLTVMPAIGETR